MRYIIILFFLLSPLFIYAQGIDDDKDLKVDTTGLITVNCEESRNLFDSDDLLRVSLAFDIKKFKKEKNHPEYQDAVLKIYFPDTTVVEKTIQLKPRGVRRLEHCHFPPIKLNFKQIAFEDEYLDQQSTMKFVTHCKTSKFYEAYILKEYLVYKMYNLLTDYSFRVRLVEMEYIDIARDEKVLVKYGFFIEHLDFLAARNNAFTFKNDRYSRRMMDRKMMARMALFEFMIGNTDWSVAGQHNTKMLKLNDLSKPGPYPVPYDFDYSGMVDTDYAVPAEGFNLESVRDRVYRGVCLGNYFVLEEIEFFKEKKQEFFDLINDFPYMEKGDKREMISYLDSFYSIIEREESVKRQIINACKE